MRKRIKGVRVYKWDKDGVPKNKKGTPVPCTLIPKPPKKSLYEDRSERDDAYSLIELDKALKLCRSGNQEEANMALKEFLKKYPVSNLGPRTKTRLTDFFATNRLESFGERRDLVFGSMTEFNRQHLCKELLGNKLPNKDRCRRAQFAGKNFIQKAKLLVLQQRVAA